MAVIVNMAERFIDESTGIQRTIVTLNEINAMSIS